MSFLKSTLKNSISRGLSQAVSKAVEKAVEPTATQLSNKAAEHINNATKSAEQATQETAETVKRNSSGLESAFANLQKSLEGYATEAAKSTKVCPNCGEVATADKKFCPSCGAKLPEHTLAEGAVCPNCGTQNTVGTKFCQECGTKLPSAEFEEQAALEKDASTLTKWNEYLPQYPEWTLGGSAFDFGGDGGYTRFSVTFPTHALADAAVKQYREVLRQAGFREAGQYPTENSLYKKIDGVCYEANTGECFEGEPETAVLYFLVGEPEGGFDYVKPEPQKKPSLRDLFK